MGKIQEDCFFYVEHLVDESEGSARVRAMCVQCAEKIRDKNALMWWPGSTNGYNPDFDLECTMSGCNRKIFVRNSSQPEEQCEQCE